MIPALNDHELEGILEAAAENGAGSAGYVLLRLPHEVEPLFVEWLRAHYPDRAEHVLSLLRQLRGGALYDSEFHSRQRGFRPVRGPAESAFREGAPPLSGSTAKSTLRTRPFRAAAARQTPAGPWVLVSIFLGPTRPSLGSAPAFVAICNRTRE